MASLESCPRCRSERLAVVYFDANDALVGGHVQCPDCGPRHAEELPFGPAAAEVQQRLLERKAS